MFKGVKYIILPISEEFKMQFNKNIEVHQANTFIQSRQTFTRNEKRLLSAIIGLVKPTDTKFVEYSISIKEWADLLGCTKENLYQIADSVTEGLMSKIVKLDYIGKDGNKAFKKFHVVSISNYDSGILSIKIAEDMNNIFLQLKNRGNYTKYELVEFVTLTSVHAQRLYELLKQYQHTKHRKRNIEISELKTMLNIDDKYKEYKDFRRHVLDIAKRQIEDTTTLRYQWRPIKKGRSYLEIEFYEIHIAGKESPTKIQEHAIMLGHIGKDIYIKEFNLYELIKDISRNKDKSYSIQITDGTWYNMKNNKELQEGLATAMTMDIKSRTKSLFDL